MSLHPTKTRLALLQAVADGDVRQCYPRPPDPIYSEMDRGYGTGRRYVKVTVKIDELERAGWVGLGEREFDRYGAPRPWLLTPAGRAVLDGAS